MKKLWIIVIAIVVVLAIAAVGAYNGLVTKSQAVETKWADVQADYQRRADLVPNLVSTVRGAAAFEQQTLTAVTEARAQATSINVSADELTPANIQAYAAAQNNLSGALGRLIAIAENYPQLTATQAFRDLQAQLEGTENRIAVSRKDFNDAVREYNTAVQRFPGSIFAGIFGFDIRGYFEAAEGSDVAPTVNFSN